MLVFRRFFGVSQLWVPTRVPYVAFFSLLLKKFLKETKMTVTTYSHGNLLLQWQTHLG